MPRGDKSAYTKKQQRQAEHIEDSYKKRGVSEDEAEERAWRTVNAESGGGKQSGSGRKAAKKGGRKSPAKKAARKTAAKRGAARKGGRKSAPRR